MRKSRPARIIDRVAEARHLVFSNSRCVRVTVAPGFECSSEFATLDARQRGRLLELLREIENEAATARRQL